VKKKWKTKQDIGLLRKSKDLSLQQLAEMVFSTNTSLFRIEKLGYCTDELLAKKIAEVLDIPVENLFEEYDKDTANVDEWNKKIRALYATEPIADRYYVLFLTTYDDYSSYSACVPTAWIDVGSEIPNEKRTPRYYNGNEVRTYLESIGIKPAIVENEDDFIHFFYSTIDGVEAVALISFDNNVIKELGVPIEVRRDYPFENKQGFNDCYYLNKLFA